MEQFYSVLLNVWESARSWFLTVLLPFIHSNFAYEMVMVFLSSLISEEIKVVIRNKCGKYIETLLYFVFYCVILAIGVAAFSLFRAAQIGSDISHVFRGLFWYMLKEHAVSVILIPILFLFISREGAKKEYRVANSIILFVVLLFF